MKVWKIIIFSFRWTKKKKKKVLFVNCLLNILHSESIFLFSSLFAIFMLLRFVSGSLLLITSAINMENLMLNDTFCAFVKK